MTLMTLQTILFIYVLYKVFNAKALNWLQTPKHQPWKSVRVATLISILGAYDASVRQNKRGSLIKWLYVDLECNIVANHHNRFCALE